MASFATLKKFALKTLSILLAGFGLVILIAIPVMTFQDFYVHFSPEVAALKIISSLVRAILLIACAVMAWRYSPKAVRFAWLALAAFLVGGAADQVVNLGIISGFQNLVSAYYLASAGHVVVALVLWLLLRKRGTSC